MAPRLLTIAKKPFVNHNWVLFGIQVAHLNFGEKAVDDNRSLEERVNTIERLQLHGLRPTARENVPLIRDLWDEVQRLQFQIRNLGSAQVKDKEKAG